MNTLAITCGDINGIGPEIIIKSLNKFLRKINSEIIVIIPENVFTRTAEFIKPIFNYSLFSEQGKKSSGIKLLYIEDVYMVFGKPTKESGSTSYQSLDKAINLIETGRADGIVTAPLSKEAFAFAGINYSGHTKLLADRSGTKDYMMTFLSEKFKTGLATVHIPISKVNKLITRELIISKLKVALKTLQSDLSISYPKIAVLGLNPHAGENGNIGKEEVEIISPAIDVVNSTFGADVFGPFVPDAFFAMRSYLNFDFVLAMYHDQGLIPFKMINFNSGVNFTAGLPYVRTSPDHGTAFDIAGKGVADESSFTQAVYWAEKILNKRNAAS